jgi:hypothetical protein
LGRRKWATRAQVIKKRKKKMKNAAILPAEEAEKVSTI